MINPTLLSIALASAVLTITAGVCDAQSTLSVEGDCPGELRAQADAMYSRAVVYLYFSPEQGSYTFPPLHQCYGVEVGLNVRRLHFVGTVRADDLGTAVWNGTSGPAACGGFLQAMDNHCQITNVARIP